MKIHTASHRRKRELPRSGVTPLPGHPTTANAEIKFQRLVDHLHTLGPRPVAELLTELVGTDEQAVIDVLHLLEKYRGLDPALVRVLGGSGFPAPPLHEVSGMTSRSLRIADDQIAAVNATMAEGGL